MGGSPSIQTYLQNLTRNPPFCNPPLLPPENCPTSLFAKPALFWYAKPTFLTGHGMNGGGGGEGKGKGRKVGGAQPMRTNGPKAMSACEKRRLITHENVFVLKDKIRFDEELGTHKKVRGRSAREPAVARRAGRLVDEAISACEKGMVMKRVASIELRNTLHDKIRLRAASFECKRMRRYAACEAAASASSKTQLADRASGKRSHLLSSSASAEPKTANRKSVFSGKLRKVCIATLAYVFLFVCNVAGNNNEAMCPSLFGCNRYRRDDGGPDGVLGSPLVCNLCSSHLFLEHQAPCPLTCGPCGVGGAWLQLGRRLKIGNVLPERFDSPKVQVSYGERLFHNSFVNSRLGYQLLTQPVRHDGCSFSGSSNCSLLLKPGGRP